MPVQDSIHGYIRLGDMGEALIDTPEMQRLRRVKQLGFINFVYPCATHTRFEHSLGAMHLAAKFAESIGLEEGEKRTLRAAALLHDVGHGPFSHTADYLFEKHDYQHEDFSEQKIHNSAISDILERHDVDPDRVCDLIHGEGRLGGIIAGHIDVDRMDYLMRDAYYTGVAYGTIETETIVRAATLHDGRLVYEEKYVSSLESLLTARYLMITPVYSHRTSKIAATMFRKAVELLRAEDGFPVERLAEMDDPEIISRLRASDAASPLMQRIDNRELYKIAMRSDDIDQDIPAVEAAFVEETGLPSDAVLVDRVDFSGTRPYDVPIRMDDELVMLEDVSELPAALKRSLEKNRELRVYADPEHHATVQDAAETVLPG